MIVDELVHLLKESGSSQACMCMVACALNLTHGNPYIWKEINSLE